MAHASLPQPRSPLLFSVVISGITHAIAQRLPLAIIALLLSLTFSATAQAQLTNIVYTTASDGSGGLVITNFSSSGTGPLVIPATIQGKTVTGIGASAFSAWSTLTSVTIPNSVKTIGQQAFEGCTVLVSVDLGQGVTGIGLQAFGSCNALTSVTIPDSVTSLGSEAFIYCSNLDTVTIGDALPSIAEGTFENCTALANLTIGTGVSSIGPNAFMGCTGLTSVTLPIGLTTIGSGAFFTCTNLTSVALPNTVTTIGGSAFASCTSLHTVRIPNSVTTIGDEAFESCTTLGSATIGASVTTIGGAAFFGTGLPSVTVPQSVTNIGDEAFAFSNLATATFEGNAPLMGSNVFEGNPIYNPSPITVFWYQGATGFTTGTWTDSSGDSYPATEYTTPIPTFEFSGGIITQYNGPGGAVTIPASINGAGVSGIATSAFAGCTTLTSVTFPPFVLNIGDYAFEGCTGLTTVTLPTYLRTIGNYAFAGCNQLTGLSIPADVTSIGNGVVVLDPDLTSFSVSAQDTAYSSLGGVLFNKTQTQLIEYTPAGGGNYTIPSGVTNIGASAFSYCNGLVTVSIPASVTSIALNAFENCTSLSSATFLGNAPTASLGLFFNVAGNFNVNFYDGVTGFSSPTWMDSFGESFPAADLGTEFSLGGEVQTTSSANITYNSGTGVFQYTDTANSTTDDAELPLAGSAASIITTSNGWTATLAPSLTAKTIGVGKAGMDLILTGVNGANTYTLLIGLAQHNYSGKTGSQSVPDDYFGTSVQFIAANASGNVATTPLGSSSTYNGVSYVTFSGGTAATATTETLAAVSGVINLSYDASTNTVTGYYNGNPVGSYSLAGWGTNPTLTLSVEGESKSIPVAAGDDTASQFFVSLAQIYGHWTTQFPTLIDVAPGDQPLNDGVPTLLKYLYDIDPSRPMSATDRAALPVFTVASSGDLTLTYRQYPFISGITVNVQMSQDLQNWVTLTGATTPIADTVHQTGADPITGDPIMQVQVPVSGAKQFLRLDVTEP